MSVYELYFSPDSANLVIRMALHEAGVRYVAHLVDRGRGEHRSAKYRALNPQGLLPVLVHGDTVLFETAAILLYLVDRHTALGPGPGHPARGDLYRWLFYLSNTLHAELRMRFYSTRYVDGVARAAGLRRAVAGRLAGHLQMLDRHVSGNECGCVLPWGLSVCDFYLGACCRWMVLYPPADPVSPGVLDALPALRSLLARLDARASVAAACACEWIEPPFLVEPRMPSPPEGSVLG